MAQRPYPYLTETGEIDRAAVVAAAHRLNAMYAEPDYASALSRVESIAAAHLGAYRFAHGLSVVTEVPEHIARELLSDGRAA